MKILPAFLSAVVWGVVVVSTASAAGLSLTSIGALNTNGAVYSHWWYTATNPTLVGTASPSANVTTTIDSTSNSVSANSSGIWSQATSNLTTGDHTVSITDGSSTLRFTLTIGSSVPAQSSGAATPNTASTGPVALFGLTSVLIIAAGSALLRFK